MTGLMMKKQIMVACLGACGALFAHAQQSYDWIKTDRPNNAPVGGGGTTVVSPEAEVQQARQVDPKRRAKIHTDLAAAYYEAGNMKVALDEAGIAIESDPDHVEAYSVRGLIYARLKENAKAEEDFRRALKIDAKNPDVNNNYGWFLCDTGQARQSIPYFLNALKDPLYATPDVAYTNAGKCAAKAGDLEGAQGYLLNALRVSHDAATGTRYELASVFYQRGNYDESKIYLNEAIKTMEPPTPEALWLGVRLERKLGNKAGEGHYASQLRSRYPTSNEYQLFLKGNFE